LNEIVDDVYSWNSMIETITKYPDTTTSVRFYIGTPQEQSASASSSSTAASSR